jgi:O-antigen ligase
MGIGLFLARQGIRRELRHAPRWVVAALAGAAVAIVAGTVVASIAADRAVAIRRLVDTDTGLDMRGRALPTVWAMIRDYFPAGAGLGSFDAVFRIHEPFALLKPTYFNHAHDDFLEIALDAGVAGVLLLCAAVAWWIVASVRAWRRPANTRDVLPRVGSVMLLLIIMASLFDYPARTPTVMALIVVAAAWLSEGAARPGRSALPARGQHL